MSWHTFTFSLILAPYDTQATDQWAGGTTVPAMCGGYGALQTGNFFTPFSYMYLKCVQSHVTLQHQSKFQTEGPGRNNIFSVIEMNFRLKTLYLIIPSAILV